MPFHHHPGLAGPHIWPLIIARIVIFALFFLVPWIIALAYVWRDARRRGQPGWLWALVGIFLSWFGILAYLIVRAFAPLPGARISPAAPYMPSGSTTVIPPTAPAGPAATVPPPPDVPPSE